MSIPILHDIFVWLIINIISRLKKKEKIMDINQIVRMRDRSIIVGVLGGLCVSVFALGRKRVALVCNNFLPKEDTMLLWQLIKLMQPCFAFSKTYLL